MTDEEFAEWGVAENRRRREEIMRVDSAEALKRAQDACAQRRKIVGLTAGRAAFAVKVGQRIERGESLSFALRAK